MKIIYPIILIVVGLISCSCMKYDDFILYNVFPTTMEQLRFLKNLEEKRYLQVIFWKRPVKMNMDVQLLVNLSENEMFLESVVHFGLRAEVLIRNIQDAFNNQTVKTYSRLVVDKLYWGFFHDLEDIYQWLVDLAARNEDVELETIGKSSEGRDILAVVIKKQEYGHKVIVEGGMHGNEWLPIAFVTYLIYHLANAESSSDSQLKDVASKYHWYLIPIVNPDGYVYSMTEDRLWRKNRRMVEGSYGVDLDRNFNYYFGDFGTSNDTADVNYCGPVAFSELESKALADYIKKHSINLKFYFSYHAYGQKIIIPYSHTLQHLENYPEMYNYGRQAVGILRSKYGTRYGLGTYYDTLGLKLSGNSAGWVKSTFKTQYVFTFLLRDNGTFGYAIPNEEIEPSCEEALTALVHIMTTKPKRFRSRYIQKQMSSGMEKISCDKIMMIVILIKVLF